MDEVRANMDLGNVSTQSKFFAEMDNINRAIENINESLYTLSEQLKPFSVESEPTKIASDALQNGSMDVQEQSQFEKVMGETLRKLQSTEMRIDRITREFRG